MARPTKINDTIIQAFQTVVNEDFNSIFLTDEELVILVNELLKPRDQFSYSAFKDWKAFALKSKVDSSPENLLKYRELESLIKRALIKQKKTLFQKFQEDSQWQKWAWILERKFADWNLRQLSEVRHDADDGWNEAIRKADEIASRYDIDPQEQELTHNEAKIEQVSPNLPITVD